MRSEYVHEAHARWFQLAGVERKLGKRPAQALFASANGLFSIGLMATFAMVRHEPLIFPSLCPTAFLLFYTPLAPPPRPATPCSGT